MNTIESLAKIFVCHSRGSNRESNVFENQGVLDSRLRGNDDRRRMLQTFARASIIKTFMLVIVSILIAEEYCYAQPKIRADKIPLNISTEVKGQIELLYSQEPELRSKAAMKLGAMGTSALPAIPFLVGMLDDEQPVLLRTEKNAVEPTSPDKEATGALVKIGKPAVEPLITVLADKNVTVRRNATEALKKVPDGRAVGPLIAVLKDEDTEVRYNAVAALGEIKDPRALEPVCALLKDKKSKIQQASREALQKIMDNMKDNRSVDLLLDALKSKEPVARQMAIQVMQDMDDNRIVGPLIAAMSDEDLNVRKKATEALGKSRDSRAVQSLVSALKDEDMDVRDIAAQALRRTGTPSVHYLVPSLKDENAAIRTKVVWILGEIKDADATLPLIETLKDEAWTVRYEAVKALGKIRDARAIEPLMDTLKDKNVNVSEYASKTLTEIGAPGVARLIFALKDEDIRIRSSAASALGATGDGRAVVPLIEALKDNSWIVRYEAVKALGKIKDARAVEPLKDAVNDKDSSVAAIAEEVLRVFNVDFKKRKDPYDTD